MFEAHKAPPSREVAKWCAYALALLAPGGWIVLPVVLLGRRWISRRNNHPAAK